MNRMSLHLIVTASLLSWAYGVLSQNIFLPPDVVYRPVTYFTGDNFNITCHSADETSILKWTDFNGNPISEEEEDRIHVQEDYSDRGQKILRLIFTDLREDDTGQYTCSDDTDSMSFELSVLRSISFLDTPSEQHLPEGETGVLLCNVRFTAATPDVMWSFKGKRITSGSKYEIQENHSLKIFNVSRNDAGEYTCAAFVATASYDRVRTMTITLHVQYPPHTEIYPQVQTAWPDRSVAIICTTFGIFKPQIEWRKKGKNLWHPLEDENYEVTDNSKGSVLRILKTRVTDYGIYECSAEGDDGELVKAKAEVKAPKTGTYGPNYFPLTEGLNAGELQVKEGHNVHLTCYVYSTGIATVTWFKDMVPRDLNYLPRYYIEDGGKRLEISNFKKEDEGSYQCMVISAGIFDNGTLFQDLGKLYLDE